MGLRWDLMWKVLPSHLEGAIVTIKLTAFSVFMGIILGTLLGMGRLSRRPVVRTLSGAYVDFFRGTPLLVQIFVVYMGLPQLGLRLSNWAAALTALSLNSGAYVAEIVRAGIESIDRGQAEAARSLGMTFLKQCSS